MLDPNYADDPRLANGSRTWQVIFQWHQGDNDQGGSPPVALIIVGDHIYLDVETVQVVPLFRLGSGRWPPWIAALGTTSLLRSSGIRRTGQLSSGTAANRSLSIQCPLGDAGSFVPISSH